MPRLDRYHRAVIVVSLLGIIIALSPLDSVTSPWVGPGLDALTLIQAMMIWGTAWLALRRGFWPARFFLLAWSISIVGICVACLYLLGFLPQTFWVRFALQLGSGLEMLVFAFAVGEWFAKFQQEKLEAERIAAQTHKLRTLVDIATHDIASPLAVIKMRADMAREESEAGLREHLGSIEEAAAQQTRILNYIRNEHLRVRTLEETNALERVALDQSIGELRSLYRMRAIQKGVELRLPDEMNLSDLFVQADGVALVHSVLDNLISNALKFSERGGVVSLSVEGPREGQVRIRVADQGVGISAPHLALIESGVSGVSIHRKGTEGEEGTGLGLSLVRSLVESFGGMLEIQSRIEGRASDGRGTIITVVLVGERKGS